MGQGRMGVRYTCPVTSQGWMWWQPAILAPLWYYQGIFGRSLSRPYCPPRSRHLVHPGGEAAILLVVTCLPWVGVADPWEEDMPGSTYLLLTRIQCICPEGRKRTQQPCASNHRVGQQGIYESLHLPHKYPSAWKEYEIKRKTLNTMRGWQTHSSWKEKKTVFEYL